MAASLFEMSFSSTVLYDEVQSELWHKNGELAFTMCGHVCRPAVCKKLGPEELGSEYESLLELHPDLDPDAEMFVLTTAGRSEGSHFPSGV